MIHLLVIALFAAVLSRETFGTAPYYDRLGSGGAIAITLGSVATIWLAAWMIVAALGRRLERRGDARAIARADMVVLVARIASVAAMVSCVLFVGWLDAVREVIASLRGMDEPIRGRSGGNLVAVDELIAVLPGLIALSFGWWVMYPIDRFVREATLIRDLDSGRSVHPILPRGKWTWQAMRHHLAIIALPIMAIVIWSELVEFAASTRLDRPDGVGNGLLTQSDMTVELGISAVQMVGAIGVLALMPLVMCRVWDTVPLRGQLAGDEAIGSIDLHERLMAHCTSARVRVRGIRVWRTGGALVNGAVIGLFAPFRYVLLTDALLERLAPRELEAVMAHEVAHIRLRHMPWLVCAVLGTILPLVSAIDLVFGMTDAEAMPRVELGLVAGVFAAGVIVFGWVSRRFEWQADAYAAKRMSNQIQREIRMTDAPGAEEVSHSRPDLADRVTLPGADTMIAALQRVANLNHVPTQRRSWRHGSIFHRQQRLYALVGKPCDALPIDRTVIRMKLCFAFAFSAGIVSTVWSIMLAMGA